MAAGKVLVASNVGGIPDLVQEGVTGFLVEPKDSEEMGAAILKIISNKARMREMGDSARRRACADFDVDAHVDRILSLYDKMGTGLAPGGQDLTTAPAH